MTQERTALVTTVSIWAVFFILVLLIPMPKVEEKITFGEMSIRLEPLPKQSQQESMQQNTQESRQQEESIARTPVLESQPQTQKAEVQTIESPSESLASVQENTVHEAPAPRREQVLQKSMEELMAEQNTRSTTSTEPKWSDDIFAQSSSVSSNNQAAGATEPRQSTTNFSGSAANSASENSPVSAQGAPNRNGSANNSVSSETSNLLSGIANAQVSSGQGKTESSSIDGTTSVNNENNTTGYNIHFEGVPRKLIDPVDPRLDISEENERLIQGSRTVQISFTVSPNGTVPHLSVTFTPSALVPPEIQSELRLQIAQWRFAAGQSSGQATFSYDIKVE